MAAARATKNRPEIAKPRETGANLLTFRPHDFHGIIRIKIHPPIISDMWNALENLLSKFSHRDFNKKLFILEKDGFVMK